MFDKKIITQQIKQYASHLGFDACGVCKAEKIGEQEQTFFDNWLSRNYNADMDYMARNMDKRADPRLLVEGTESIISVALNYYPEIKQPASHPQFAYYAYGKDYHDIVKDKLQSLLSYIKTLYPSVQGRAFCDTAPLLERYWAVKAGLGFIAKNSLLILPRKGSFFFLGELLIEIELDYDTPLNMSCGKCMQCIEACPTQAIVSPKIVNSHKCISYQTIENKGDIDAAIKITNQIYGCDICQQVCPWNRFAQPHSTSEFNPSESFLNLTFDKLNDLSIDEYQKIFKGSAIKRAKYTGLKRNLAQIKKG